MLTTAKAAGPRHGDMSAAPQRQTDSLVDDLDTAVGLPRYLGIQTKLEIGSRDDPLEREADALARAVHHNEPLCDASCLSSSLMGTSPTTARRSSAEAPHRPPSPAESGSHDLLPAEGAAPLSSHVRSRIEPLLDADLSGVQVHTGPASARAARQLQARAFTHGNHIWLGQRGSPEDVELLAHEATHVVQQRAAPRGPGERVQRSPEEYIHHEDGATVQSNMTAAVDEELEDVDESDREDAPEPSEMPRGERSRLKGELADDGALPADRAAEAKPSVDSAATDAKAEADEAAEPLAEGSEQAPAAGEEGELGAAADAAAGLAAAAESPPEAPPSVVPIMPFAPFDSEGATVAADVVADAATVTLGGELQRMREEGADARTRATVIKNNAGVMRANLELAQGQIDSADEALTAAESNVEARREITAQGRDALTISEEKASQVAAEAPGYVDRASDAHEDSGPMASEAGAMAGDAAGQNPEDEEAAGKMQEVAGGMSSVGSDAGSVDGAVTETQTRAESLVTDAAEAQEKNSATGGKLDATEGALDQADESLGQLGEQNQLAQAQVSALTEGPGRMEAGAADLDSQARGIIEHSMALEAELRASEESYQAEMRSVAGKEAIAAAAERDSGGATGVIQRSAESAYGDRVSVDLLSAFRSPPSAAELRDQERRRMEADERRRERIRDIEARANGDFSSLGALDRMSIALDVTGENLWNGASEIDWPNMAGQVILAFIDPTVSLEGVITGLNGVLSGAANLFSLEQWERDPLGNLLKSAADIATGLTTILGSIAGLCTAILVILGALAIFTFGAMGPVFAAASAFLGPIISTVGGWALVTAAIAAELHALVFIKNLIDAATADTAAELEHESDQMTEDATQFASAASEVVLDGIVEAGGARLANTPTGRAIGSAVETVGRDFDMIPPPRVRPDVDLPPASALGEAPPAAAVAPETAAIAPETAAIAPETAALPEAPARPTGAPETAAPPAAREAAPAAGTEVVPPAPARPVTPEPPPPPAPPPPAPAPAAATPPASSATATPATATPAAAAPPSAAPAAATRPPETPPAPRTPAPPETPAAAPPASTTAPPRPPETPPPASAPATPRPPERLGGATAEGVGGDFTYETFPPARMPEVDVRRPRPGAESPTGAVEGAARVGEADVPARAPESVSGRAPDTSSTDPGAAARQYLDEHLENMVENNIQPEDLGFSAREWEQFQRDYAADPERALADLERRRDVHDDGRATRSEGEAGDVAREVEARADDIRERMNPQASESTTAAERAAGRAEGERAAAERRAAVEDQVPTVPDERPSDLFDDPEAPTPRSGEPLQRPPLRQEVIDAIEGAAELNEHRQFVDKDGNVLNEPCYGHKCGYENRRIIAAAEELGLTQQQLNDFINEHPEYFFMEETAANLSHQGEMPGLEPYDHILEEMETWLRNRGGR